MMSFLPLFSTYISHFHNLTNFDTLEKNSEKSNGPRRNMRGIGSLLAPIPNFIQIGQKPKLEIFSVG